VQCTVSVCRHYRVVIPRSGYRMASVKKVRPTAVYFTVLRWHVLFLVFLGSRGDPSAAFSLAEYPKVAPVHAKHRSCHASRPSRLTLHNNEQSTSQPRQPLVFTRYHARYIDTPAHARQRRTTSSATRISHTPARPLHCDSPSPSLHALRRSHPPYSLATAAMGFGDFSSICERTPLPLCPLVGARSAITGSHFTQSQCYSRSIELANTIIFQGAAGFAHIITLIMLVIMIIHVRSKFTAVGTSMGRMEERIMECSHERGGSENVYTQRRHAWINC
jgi:hypothetical protein